MKQFVAISKNTYLQAVRQPVYGIIVLVTLGGLAVSPSFTAFTMDDDNKMLRDIGLSTLLIQGLFLGCFVASSVLDSEIEDKTVLTVAAKPVPRSVFILAKYVGVLAALATAHYLACLAFFMTLRHGVLQSASEEIDMTVMLLGPGVMLLLLVAAGLLNYVYDWRFLPTVVTLAVPALTFGALILLFIDRDFSMKEFVTTQAIPALPREIVEQPDPFKGIIEFRPDPGNAYVAGHSGKLVRSNWRGPIGDADREYLLSLHDDVQWRKNIDFLVKDARELIGIEVAKAAVLILGAIALLASIAVASSTRFGATPTFLVSLLVVCAGLASDQIVKPIADAGKTWAALVYRLIPNFQTFWMVDALNEDRLIPLDYIGTAFGYGAIYVAAVLLLAIALFETREVG